MSNLENYMKQQAIFCEQNDSISKNLYSEYGVKRGLRDEKGQGVLTGLTNISDIKAFEYRDGVKSPCDGELSYRGYNIKDLVTGSKGKRFIYCWKFPAPIKTRYKIHRTGSKSTGYSIIVTYGTWWW